MSDAKAKTGDVRIENFRHRVLRNSGARVYDKQKADAADKDDQDMKKRNGDTTESIAGMIDGMFNDAVTDSVLKKQKQFMLDVRALLVGLLGRSDESSIDTRMILSEICRGEWPEEVWQTEATKLKSGFEKLIKATIQKTE